MRKEITPEMYNYNKFPGPKFERLLDQVRSEGIELTLVANHKDAFDVLAFEQRFSSLMLKFDYIVGDWGNEQLRLKGFYKEDKSVDKSQKISRLQDYLLEYCNYGCAYFVLENPNPQEPEPEKEGRSQRPKRNRRNRSRRKPEEGKKASTNPVENKSTQDRQQDKGGHKRRRKKNSRHFSIKEETSRQEKSTKKSVQENKRTFVIRQKD